MTISLDHTIVPARDKHAAAEFLGNVLGLEVTTDPGGYFAQLTLANGVTLDYYDGPGFQSGFPSLHWAFVVTDEEFDAAMGRLIEAGVRYYALPHQPDETAHQVSYSARGHRGVYFPDPEGHGMELLTATEDPADEWWVGDYRNATAAELPKG
ncbi:catechol 2,3-dioxygenase-like lactoylglutathione lyase family enzyme [Tamaricihabitans halophyticus]|uniref:Catechol 2,3-dioxygenase-like lactoylglutathione lyase family enzyme n=1 Tax=Tamaricihabitans halophyticus TaxID=1262583 RepID=A0A4V6NRA4_9PSEU|nr:VOC family protein [Tamaricihabitans halophyticus]TCP50966.1 catechol 2,3-dioxygenase-like lactoylglutathione lyase family enzyme [Tamaricihabitans halophyticus]